MSHLRISRVSPTLLDYLASPEEVWAELRNNVTPTEVQDLRSFERVTMGPIKLLLLDQRDDEGNRFVSFSALCANAGNGPYTVTAVGKRWNVRMTGTFLR